MVKLLLDFKKIKFHKKKKISQRIFKNQIIQSFTEATRIGRHKLVLKKKGRWYECWECVSSISLIRMSTP